MERFESQRLISLSAKRLKGTPFARVNPSAYTYYNNRELRKAAEDAAKAEADALALAAAPERVELPIAAADAPVAAAIRAAAAAAANDADALGSMRCMSA